MSASLVFIGQLQSANLTQKDSPPSLLQKVAGRLSRLSLNRFVETDRDGKILNSYPVPVMTIEAQRLPDGSTISSDRFGVIYFDSTGRKEIFSRMQWLGSCRGRNKIHFPPSFETSKSSIQMIDPASALLMKPSHSRIFQSFDWMDKFSK